MPDGERFTVDLPRAVRLPRLLTPTECADAEPRGYVVKTILAPGDCCIVFGEPGAGKSILAPHVAYATAQGRNVFGRRVRQGVVIYCASEDPHGMRQRVKALRQVHGDAPDFRLLCDGPNLNTGPNSNRKFLLDSVGQLKPVLVVIDTLRASFPGVEENTDIGMDEVVRLAREIAATGPSVIIVHHSPKGGDTPRGHSVLNGDADVTIRVTMEGETRRVTCTTVKNRNGPSGQRLAFDIAPIDIGRDEDGDAITAPIAKEDEAGAKREEAVTLTALEARARELLIETLLKSGRALPDDGWHPRLLGVPEDAWQDVCEDRRLSTSDVPENRKKVFRKTYKALLEKRAVATRNGVVWATRPTDELKQTAEARYREPWNQADPSKQGLEPDGIE